MPPWARRALTRLGVPPWAMLVVGFWCALVAVNYIARRITGTHAMSCLLRRVTGVPCPTCGGTRAAVSLAMGHPISALAFNPAVTIGLIALPIWVVWRLTRRDAPRPPMSRRTRTIAWVVGLSVLFANWAYVLWHEGAI